MSAISVDVARNAIKHILARRDLTFAECGDAEEIMAKAKEALDALEKPGNSGWLIERYVNGTLKYWNGRPLQDGANRVGRDGAFTHDHLAAIRFAREEDASVVLAWLCDGIGRVAQHSWMERADASTETDAAGMSGKELAIVLDDFAGRLGQLSKADVGEAPAQIREAARRLQGEKNATITFPGRAPVLPIPPEDDASPAADVRERVVEINARIAAEMPKRETAFSFASQDRRDLLWLLEHIALLAQPDARKAADGDTVGLRVACTSARIDALEEVAAWCDHQEKHDTFGMTDDMADRGLAAGYREVAAHCRRLSQRPERK